MCAVKHDTEVLHIYQNLVTSFCCFVVLLIHYNNKISLQQQDIRDPEVGRIRRSSRVVYLRCIGGLRWNACSSCRCFAAQPVCGRGDVTCDQRKPNHSPTSSISSLSIYEWPKTFVQSAARQSTSFPCHQKFVHHALGEEPGAFPRQKKNRLPARILVAAKPAREEMETSDKLHLQDSPD